MNIMMHEHDARGAMAGLAVRGQVQAAQCYVRGAWAVMPPSPSSAIYNYNSRFASNTIYKYNNVIIYFYNTYVSCVCCRVYSRVYRDSTHKSNNKSDWTH